jgi:hypothetical protein
VRGQHRSAVTGKGGDLLIMTIQTYVFTFGNIKDLDYPFRDAFEQGIYAKEIKKGIDNFVLCYVIAHTTDTP